MSAANAFAASSDSPPLPTNGHKHHHEEPRPSKRQRTVEVLPPPVWLPSAQPETSLEVDVMVLDYIAFHATTACLQSRKPAEDVPSTALRRRLQLVDSFVPIFKARHTQYKADAELRLRLLLLKMSSLFTQRLTLNPTTPDRSALHALRNANRQRAEAWLAGAGARRPAGHIFGAFTLPPGRLERNRAQVLHQLGVPAEDEDYEDAFYGTTASVSLLDLLPLFVELSAVSSSIHGSSLTARWMHLACEFMLQACLEQYLVCGATDADALNEAFAWGYADETGGAKTGRVPEINELFEDDEYAQEVDGWSALKAEYVQELVGDGAPSPESATGESNVCGHLERVSAQHPKDEFEASVLKFLEALSASIAQPVLVQLEEGQLEGMSQEETREFLKECGVDLALS